MGKEKYALQIDADKLSYEFISEGPKGKVLKVVLYQHIVENIYNLAFGDSIGLSKDFDDFVRTNNNDTEKVLLTVASTLYLFFEKYDGTLVIAKGSTHSRTRLYRKYLSAFLEIIEADFELYGELDGKLERFKKGTDYNFFMINKVSAK
ncbi:MAG: hypothetical protein H6567_11870 [Lewinellaceae bacterium]|nr:hypothetical protein [Lewinellaceae bacterium]